MDLTAEMVTFDCTDPARLAQWWSTALGGKVVPVVPGEFLIVARETGPRLGFQRVADPTPGKARIHLDFSTKDSKPRSEGWSVSEPPRRNATPSVNSAGSYSKTPTATCSASRR